MSQTLRVNEKEYLPSSDLASRFNYTSDYISKLARDEKVLGTRVGRQWFVEAESLRTYIQQLEVEKRIAQENLSRQRKVERQMSGKPDPLVPPNNQVSHVSAAGQALAVTMCGLLVGVIALTAHIYDLKMAHIKDGVQEVSSRVAKQLSAGLVFLGESKNSDPRKNGQKNGTFQDKINIIQVERLGVGPQFEKAAVYATFPVLSSSSSVESELQVTAVSEALRGLLFSDDIVVTEVDGDAYVRTVFDNSVGKAVPLSELSLPLNNQR